MAKIVSKAEYNQIKKCLDGGKKVADVAKEYHRCLTTIIFKGTEVDIVIGINQPARKVAVEVLRPLKVISRDKWWHLKKTSHTIKTPKIAMVPYYKVVIIEKNGEGEDD